MRSRFITLLPAAALVAVILSYAPFPAAGAPAGAIQNAEINQLTNEIADLESKAAKLRLAVENCKRRITAQSPDCQVEVSWTSQIIPYQEAERVIRTLEEQARGKRRRIDFLKSQQPPPPPPTRPTAPPISSQSPGHKPPAADKTTGQNQKPQAEPKPTQPIQSQPKVMTPPAAAPRPQAYEPRIGGLTPKEWDLLRSWQTKIDGLRAKWPLSREEDEKLEKLETDRNRMWVKAISVPGLTAEERQRLRLLLHTRSLSADTPVLRREDWVPVGKKKPVPPPFPADGLGSVVQSYVEVGTGEMLDEMGKDWVEKINIEGVDRGMLNFGNVIGVSKISLKLKEKDYPGAIAESFDFVMGKLVRPLASMNVAVFKSAYSRVIFGAMNKFLEDSMNMVGGDVSWEDITKNMNTGQKAVMEWTGLGDLMRASDREKRK